MPFKSIRFGQCFLPLKLPPSAFGSLLTCHDVQHTKSPVHPCDCPMAFGHALCHGACVVSGRICSGPKVRKSHLESGVLPFFGRLFVHLFMQFWWVTPANRRDRSWREMTLFFIVHTTEKDCTMEIFWPNPCSLCQILTNC